MKLQSDYDSLTKIYENGEELDDLSLEYQNGTVECPYRN